MKSFFLVGLIGLMVTACSTGDDDDLLFVDLRSRIDSIDRQIVDYEGKWSIDGVPVEQTYTVTYVFNQDNDEMEVVFPTFPYQAATEHILPDVNVTNCVMPRALSLQISLVGQSMKNNYFNAVEAVSMVGKIDALDFGLKQLSYYVKTPEEGTIVITLGLDYSQSVFSFSDTSAGCILVLQHVEMYYEDGRHKTLVLNPAIKLTFVSTKRL